MKLLEKSGLTAPTGKNVVLLPDHAFFVRVVPLPPGTPAAEVPAQVELALEGLSPFPIGHLCYGFFHREGSGRVLVYAAYRRRFTVDDAALWTEADAVLPSFASWLGLASGGPRTLLVNGADYLTLIAWDGADPVPASVVTRPVPADAPPEARAAAQAELLAQFPDRPEPAAVPAAAPCLSRPGDEGLAFGVDGVNSRFDSSQLDALDVRDKTELAARRSSRRRDLLLWRIYLGTLVALLLALVLEGGLKAGAMWVHTREIIAAARAPAVQDIETKNSLADHIQDLSTHRLLPLEMITLVGEKLKGSSIQFLRTSTKGLDTLEIEGQTNSASDLFNYQAALQGMPACQQVALGQTTERGGVTRFVLTVTFKDGALQPAVTSP